MAGFNRDIVVIGGSAGSIEPLKQLVAGLPADFAGAVFVVVHIGAMSMLASILDQAGPLPAKRAEHGEAFAPGTILVAPPGRHLMLHDKHVLLSRGPRENFARPAIDPLFRSAAASFSSRVIGVVLSGSLNDGTAGLRAIKRCGGIAIVQRADDAAFPGMPQSALKYAPVDHCLPAAAIAPRIGELVKDRAGPAPAIPLDIRLETAIAAQELNGMEAEDRLGTQAPFTCPICHGALWEMNDGGLLRYRCHVGHSFTGEVMAAAQTREAERILSTLLRTHQQRAGLARRMAEEERRHQRAGLAAQLESRAREYDEAAALVMRLLRDGGSEEQSALLPGQDELEIGD